MTTLAFDLACLGRAAVDLYGEQVGCRLEDVATFAKYLGGSPANTAVGASRLGLRVAMVTRVGNEQNGTFVRETLAREGVDVSQVGTDPQCLTALVFLALRGRDDFPHIFYRDHCADMALRAEHVDGHFIAGCGALLVSGTHLSQPGPRAACVTAIEAARAAGRRVILDIDYRPVLWGLVPPGEGASRYVDSPEATQSLSPILSSCDLLVGTEEEIRIAGGSADTLMALRAIRFVSAAVIVLKRGAEGCIAFPGPVTSLEAGVAHGGFAVEVFNSLGAGDAFMAGFLRGWLRNESLERCCQWANATGAIVVSRHGCAPAMPTWPELTRFLTQGVTHRRLREDRALDHVHRATTRRPAPALLQVLAFDHRGYFEALAGPGDASHEKIARFKALVARAFELVARDHPGAGIVLDDRYGADLLAQLGGKGHWVARPVEVPNSNPLAFEPGAQLGLALRTWPTAQVVKCLVYFGTQDTAQHRRGQVDSLRTLAEACAVTGHELLLEVMPPDGAPPDAPGIASALEAIYEAGVRPDWWKLPPNPEAHSWAAIGSAIERHDPLCRGVLVLGMEAGPEALRQGFRAASGSPWVRGFAVGRSIFSASAEGWFAGQLDDAQVVAAVARNYEEVIALWDAAARAAAPPSTPRIKENA